jgi:hypothetical protein
MQAGERPSAVLGKQPAGRAMPAKDDGAMRAETRRRKKAFDFLKVLMKFAFSQAGVIIICIVYSVGGANIYMSLEKPAEEERYAEKREKASQILASMDFLPKTWWNFIHHKRPEERYNETAFKDRVGSDVFGLIMQIVDAAANQKYDGEIEGWEWDWWVLPRCSLIPQVLSQRPALHHYHLHNHRLRPHLPKDG